MFIGFILVSAPGLHKISNTTTAFHTLTNAKRNCWRHSNPKV